MPKRNLIRVATSAMVAIGALFTTASSVSWGQNEHGHAGGHQAAEACSAEFDKVVAEGRGFGMAFAADQNGYPGPMHVLELKDRLKLTPDQEARARTLMHAMFSESKPKSARLLAAEAKLRGLFADRAADDTAVRAAVGEVERARSEVRLVHLLAHLKTRDLLTEDQRRIYHEARWSGR
jgi:Spy/CpxP family protein refolding chaperone